MHDALLTSCTIVTRLEILRALLFYTNEAPRLPDKLGYTYAPTARARRSLQLTCTHLRSTVIQQKLTSPTGYYTTTMALITGKSR
jgi:hypothetical protein